MLRFILLVLFLGPVVVSAQDHQLYAVHSKWDDSFREWELQTMDEDLEGELKMRWSFRDDFTQWDFNLGDEHGEVKLKFPTGLQQWEVRYGNEVVLVQQQWQGDVRQWRVTDNTITLHFKTKWGNNPFEWEMREESRYGKFRMYTEYDGDPRDWVIVDELSEEISTTLKMGMAFIALFQVMPKQ